MEHPWFSRVWVVQEVVVASRATFFYGGEPIPWMDLYGWQKTLCNGSVISSLTSFAWGSAESFGWDSHDLLGFLSLSFTVAYRMQYHASLRKRLGHVLRVFGEKDATKHVDKVFAVIGMAEDGTDDRLKTLIDYERPKEDVLLDLANYLLDTEQALEVFDLGGLRQPGRIPGLLSWAVDWTAARVVKALNPIFSSYNVCYHASGSELANVQRGSSRKELVVTGQTIDEIVWLAPFPDIPPGQSSGSAPVIGRYPCEAQSLARQHAQDPYPHWRGGQPLDEAVWRTLLGDSSSSERPAPATCLDTARTMTGLTSAMGTRFSPDQLFASTQETLQRELGVTPEQQQEIQRAVEEFSEIDFLFDSGKGSSPLIFCVTKKGYVSMVPHVSKTKDKICLVYGVDVPCILRAVEEKNGTTVTEKHEFVGDAYVHGIMDGEALGRGNEREFILV
jgi:hypothetical protein